VGAVVNLLSRPVLWPGVFQAHELFHVFVIAASALHYWFMLTVIAPFEHESQRRTAEDAEPGQLSLQLSAANGSFGPG
jgi:hypothetical protein